ncbi:MAG: prepilin-type N-terminal cleavage/methylation domain-containing protein [Verrucomicrobiota bacterium]|nr:prepilin-type N-terminal cleavage/methylation domain-containing protein [Verrucomicrobiota bacterium]
MPCSPSPYSSAPFGLLTQGRAAAFTLIEIVIALAVIGVMSAGCYIGFNAVNTYAVSSRLYSEAQTAAQNQIDLILSKEPFDIKAAYISGSFDPTLSKIPIELMTTGELDALAASGVTFPTAAPTATPAVTSSYYPYYPYYRTGTGQPALKQAFIYQDPVTGKVLVTGALTSTITDSGMSMNFINNTNLNTRKANVTVTYDFRKTTDASGNPTRGNYTLSMDTLRTADQ